MKENIGIIIQKLKNGGAERAAANLSKDLSEKYNVYLITFDGTDIAYEYGGSLINIDLPATNNKIKKIINFIKRIIRVRKVKKEKNINISISFMEGANLINILSKKKDIVITSERNLPSFFYKRKTKIKYICNKADKIVTLSKLVREDLVNNFGINREKIIPIYNSCDLNRLNIYSNEVNEIVKTFDKNKRYIITMGRLNYQKGQWHLIKAFEIVKNKIPNVELLILGKGELEGQLKELVQKMELQESVKFLGYMKNPHTILNYCDIFVFSSIVEGLGNVLLEALAFSKPIVSTDCDAGPREILAPNTDMNKKTNEIEYAEYGVLVPAFSEERINENNIKDEEKEGMLANAIIRLLEDYELRKKYEIKAKERIKEFEPNIIKQKWFKLIEIVRNEEKNEKR